MKVLLYSQHLKQIAHSGLGKAIQHQQAALELAGIDYTTNPHDAFDLLHINTYFPQSVRLAHRCRRRGIPVVYHAHSNADDFRNSFRGSNQLAPLVKRWLIHAYRQGDLLIAPTPHAKRVLQSYQIDRPIHVISNGIDLAQFSPIPNAREQFRRRYHFGESDFVVVGIGLYLKRKGILDFVELTKRLPEVQFIWFGETDLALVPHEIKVAVTTDLPNLTFAGYVPNDDIRLALQAGDVYLFPTHEETEGIPAIEACASKINFIVRDLPVFSDWLFDRHNVYKGQTIDDFQALIEAFRLEELPSLTDQAYQVAQERDLAVIGQQLADAYQTAWQLTHS